MEGAAARKVSPCPSHHPETDPRSTLHQEVVMPTPVIVLPGFYGSKLSASAHDQLIWLDIAGLANAQATMDALRFDPSDPDRVEATGILDEVNVVPFFWSVDIYKKFVTFLQANLQLQVYEFWFDWRRSLVDSAESLHRRIQRVLQN